jgi:hypothetical protein
MMVTATVCLPEVFLRIRLWLGGFPGNRLKVHICGEILLPGPIIYGEILLPGLLVYGEILLPGPIVAGKSIEEACDSSFTRRFTSSSGYYRRVCGAGGG